MSDGGKGDKRRPASISQEELKERWEAIFKPKQKETEKLGQGTNAVSKVLSTKQREGESSQ